LFCATFEHWQQKCHCIAGEHDLENNENCNDERANCQILTMFLKTGEPKTTTTMTMMMLKIQNKIMHKQYYSIMFYFTQKMT
jgi:hypothetical protein